MLIHVKNFLRKLKSIRFLVFIVILFVGLISCVAMHFGIMESYEERAVSLRTSDVQNQLKVIGNHLLANNYLGMVRQYQHFTYKDNYSVVDLSGSPDLEKLAAAYDMKFLRLENMTEAESTIDEFLANDESVLLECLIDPMDLV